MLLSGVWLYLLENPDPSVVAHYGVGVVAFAVSACLEVLVEPLFATGQAFLFIRLKVSICSPQLESMVLFSSELGYDFHLQGCPWGNRLRKM